MFNNRSAVSFFSQLHNMKLVCTFSTGISSSFKETCINKISRNYKARYILHRNNGTFNNFTEDKGFIKKDEWVEKASAKRIELNAKKHKALLEVKPHQPLNPRILKIAIFGLANTGKSTLANQIIGWRFSGVSKKVHTTRHQSVGVFTEGNTQLIFLDTPGVITPDKKARHRLEDTLLLDPHSSLYVADIILVMVDVSVKWQRNVIDKEILKVLHLQKYKKKILILNKCDLFRDNKELMHTTRILSNGVIGGKSDWYKIPQPKKKDVNLKVLFDKVHSETTDTLCESNEGNNEEERATSFNIEDLDLTDKMQWQTYQNTLKSIENTMSSKVGYSGFDRVFHISALENIGVQDIKDYLIEAAKPGDWQYNESVITDLNPIEIAKMCIRDKLMDYLPKEIPYVAQINLKLWEVDEDGLLRSQFEVILPKRKHLIRMLLHDRQIVDIAGEAKQDLMNTFKREMTLHLVLKWGNKMPKEKKPYKK